MTVPKPLRNLDLIRVCHPAECRSHADCNSPGKRPVSAATRAAVEPLRDIERWMDHGGNYGVLCHQDNGLLIFDVDSDRFRQMLKTNLPPTFVVESGGAGVGQHWYYRCPEWVDNNRWSDPEGSLRAKNYHAVGPGCTHAKTGDSYEIVENREFTTVGAAAVEHLVEKLDREAARRRRPGGGGAPPASRPTNDSDSHRSQNTKKAADLDVEPSAETFQALEFINSDKRRQDVAKVIDHEQPSRRVRAWAAGFLHSACGLRQNQIERLLKERADWATDKQEIKRQVCNMLKEVVRNQRANESVDLDRYLGPDDMTASAVESRKTEESGSSRTLRGGVLEMVNDNVNNHVTEKNGSVVVRSGVVHVNPKTSDNEWDYMGLLFGEFEEEEEDLGKIVNWEYDQYNNKDFKNLGNRSPEELRLAAEALEELADNIED